MLTNQDLEKMVDTSNEWIVQRVGILQRHIAPPEIATSDMAVEAAKIALEQRGIDALRAGCDHRVHRHARHAVSLHRLPGAGPPGRQARLGIRSGGRLLGFHLRPDHGRAPGLGRARTRKCW